ncbi:non-ribosomal peptide synthetase [Belnapia moabensis]|uniref:non-ribosomal peptide synthetase n=1 Tax=Belnapia moabensis TaxID=365533 RepID=UPI000694B4C9|nr:non-ribosomal peptide synthetase [Belnapia moabensis]
MDIAGRVGALTPEARLRLLRRLRDRSGGDGTDCLPLVPVPRNGTDFPLSFNQERLWFLDQLTPGNPFYNLASAQVLDFAMDAAVLDHALAELARRHEALRTSFPVARGEPVQRVAAAVDLACETVALDAIAPEEREATARRRAAAFAAAPFDLARGPLLRALVARLGPHRSLFACAIHHIIADGWSVGLLMRELAALYRAFAGGGWAVLPPPPLHYVDYAVWQRGRAAAGETERELAFWKRQLDGLTTLELPTDRPRPRVQRFAGDQLPLALPERLAEAARGLATRQGTTLFVVLLAAFMALLHRYSGQEDVPVGVPVANRPRAELEEVVGFFANTLVLRGDVRGNLSFGEFVARLHHTVVEALEHQELPFSTLVAALRPNPDLSRNPLFQVSFQLVAGVPGAGAAPGAQSGALGIDRTTSIFDLSVNLWEAGKAVEGLVEFDTDLFDRATIERMAGHYLTLLETALRAPETGVGALPLMTEAERTLVLETWNATAIPVPPDGLLHGLVERQAELTPEACAVRQGPAALSFAELDATADRLAAALARRGICRGWRVGLRMRPSPGLLVAILGVLKAGGAFVPLDPAMPAVRSAAMLADCGASLLLTDGDASDPPAEAGCDVVALGDLLSATCGDGAKPDPGVGPEDVAYVMFTSGSTGRPKGVMIPHRAAVNYLAWCLATYPVSDGVGAPLCSPVSSDMSITTLFLPLLAGRTVVLLGPGHPVEELERLLAAGERFGFVKLTPSHLEALRLLSGGRVRAEATAAFVVGGEQLYGEALAPWRDQAPGVMVFNEYGPTETTVGCCVHALRTGECAPGPVPIGRPIANTRLYVLDSWGSPVPVMVPGELHIGGAGVGLGYAGRPELTAGSFVEDPFSPDPQARLYRTGDRVRWRRDGTLEYLGRFDEQLKVRGHRVEPGEIEAVLRGHGAVQDAAVIGRKLGGDMRLVAFVVPSAGLTGDAELWSASLRDHLAGRLPKHMLPGAFIPIETIPLTASGKVDRRVLAALDAPAAAPAAEDGTPPRDAVEEVVSRVFADVLGARRVTVRDDFFAELGGHSLLAARAVARLRELLGVELPLGRLFEAPTVEALARSLRAETADAAELEIIARAVIQVLDIGDDQVGTMLGEDGAQPHADQQDARCT